MKKPRRKDEVHAHILNGETIKYVRVYEDDEYYAEETAALMTLPRGMSHRVPGLGWRSGIRNDMFVVEVDV